MSNTQILTNADNNIKIPLERDDCLNICYIVGAGECGKLDFIPDKSDMIIAADGGLRYLEKAGINPDVIIGDFDSLGINPEGENVIRLKPEKDITDMHAAVSIGLEKGYNKFKLYGALGGRIDHSLANIQLTASLSQRNIKAEICDKKSYITAITNGCIRFDSSRKGYISVFSHSDVSEGVSIDGLKYELNNSDLKNTFPLGVSNEFIGKPSEISVRSGTLIIVIFNS